MSSSRPSPQDKFLAYGLTAESTDEEIAAYAKKVKADLTEFISQELHKDFGLTFSEQFAVVLHITSQDFFVSDKLLKNLTFKKLIDDLSLHSFTKLFMRCIENLPLDFRYEKKLHFFFTELAEVYDEIEDDDEVIALREAIHLEFAFHSLRVQSNLAASIVHMCNAASGTNALDAMIRIHIHTSTFLLRKNITPTSIAIYYCALAIVHDHIGMTDVARENLHLLLTKSAVHKLPRVLHTPFFDLVVKPAYHYGPNDHFPKIKDAEAKQKLVAMLSTSAADPKKQQDLLWQALIPTTFIGAYLHRNVPLLSSASNMNNNGCEVAVVAKELHLHLSAKKSSDPIQMTDHTKELLLNFVTKNKIFAAGLRRQVYLYDCLMKYLDQPILATTKNVNAFKWNKPKITLEKSWSVKLLDSPSPSPT